MLRLDEHILARYEGDVHVRLLNCWFAIYSRPCSAIPIAEDLADPLVKALAGQREKITRRIRLASGIKPRFFLFQLNVSQPTN